MLFRVGEAGKYGESGVKGGPGKNRKGSRAMPNTIFFGLRMFGTNDD